MKKITISIAIVISLLAIPPYFIGSSAESTIRELVSKVNENASINLEMTEYHRGWFSSEAKITMSIVAPNVKPDDLPTFTVTQMIQHGPILWQAAGLGLGVADVTENLTLPAKIQKELDELKGLPDNVFESNSRLYFDRSWVSNITIAPFVIDDDKATISVSPGKFIAHFNSNDTINFEGNWQGIKVEDKNNKSFALGDINIDMQQRSINGEMFGPTALYEGKFDFEIKQIVTKGPAPDDNFSAEAISVKSLSAFENKLANMDIVFAIKKLNVMAMDFSDIVYDTSFHNISQEALLAFNQIAAQPNNADPAVLQQKALAILPKLIDSNPLIKINTFGMTTDEGKTDIKLEIAIDKSLYDAANPMSLVAAIDATSSGYSPEKFYAKLGLTEMINGLIQQNLLVRDNSNLKFEASFKKGKAVLNGKEIPLGM
jgi:uncharacterized protein YdgA (DUF945 family)